MQWKMTNHRLKVVCLLLLSVCQLCCSFGIHQGRKAPETKVSSTNDHKVQTQQQFLEPKFRKAALSIAVVATAMTISPKLPSNAAVPTLNEAIVEFSETSYPILRSLDSSNFQALSIKMGELLLDNINSDKLAKSIDLGIDVLDSANLQQGENLNSVLNEVYGPLSTETCTLVPLPPMSIVDRFVTIALDKVDAQKLQAFQKMWNPSLETLKKTETSICLPPTRAALDKMALAQAEVGRSFGKQEARSFASYTG